VCTRPGGPSGAFSSNAIGRTASAALQLCQALLAFPFRYHVICRGPALRLLLLRAVVVRLGPRWAAPSWAAPTAGRSGHDPVVDSCFRQRMKQWPWPWPYGALMGAHRRATCMGPRPSVKTPARHVAQVQVQGEEQPHSLLSPQTRHQGGGSASCSTQTSLPTRLRSTSQRRLHVSSTACCCSPSGWLAGGWQVHPGHRRRLHGLGRSSVGQALPGRTSWGQWCMRGRQSHTSC
jgi:hypothetical protein